MEVESFFTMKKKIIFFQKRINGGTLKSEEEEEEIFYHFLLFPPQHGYHCVNLIYQNTFAFYFKTIISKSARGVDRID